MAVRIMSAVETTLLLRRVAAADGTIYALVDVAAPDVDPIGVARVVGPTADGAAEVTGLFVAPSYRRQGLGGRILSEVVDMLRGQGVVRVVARVGDNVAARRLCERAGFKVVDAAGTRLSADL